VPEHFFDLTLPDFDKMKYWMPSAWDKKTASAGIDCDAQGNVLVCDLVNHAIVEIGPDGKLRSTTPIAWPDRVLVSRKTGDLFVIYNHNLREIQDRFSRDSNELLVKVQYAFRR